MLFDFPCCLDLYLSAMIIILSNFLVLRLCEKTQINLLYPTQHIVFDTLHNCEESQFFDLGSTTKPYSSMFEHTKKHDFHQHLTIRRLGSFKFVPKTYCAPNFRHKLFLKGKIHLKKLFAHFLSVFFVNVCIAFSCCFDLYLTTMKFILYNFSVLGFCEKNLINLLYPTEHILFDTLHNCEGSQFFDLVTTTKPYFRMIEYTKKRNFYQHLTDRFVQIRSENRMRPRF